jgi:hypothetical protein
MTLGATMRTQEMHSTRVFMLGRFTVERDGDAIPTTAWRRRRPVELPNERRTINNRSIQWH